jgi:hypothetical protein
VISSAINLTSEKEQPATQRNQNPEAKVDERQRAKMSFDLRPDEDPSQNQNANYSDSDAQHPRRKK